MLLESLFIAYISYLFLTLIRITNIRSHHFAALLHVMDSLANHRCLIMDMTDGDTNTDNAIKMSKMWEATTKFFDAVINNDEASKKTPPMQVAEGVRSSHAMVGFASFKDGDNQFLETRLCQLDRALHPQVLLWRTHGVCWIPG